VAMSTLRIVKCILARRTGRDGDQMTKNGEKELEKGCLLATIGAKDR